jgi:hypothetical protein
MKAKSALILERREHSCPIRLSLGAWSGDGDREKVDFLWPAMVARGGGLPPCPSLELAHGGATCKGRRLSFVLLQLAMEARGRTSAAQSSVDLEIGGAEAQVLRLAMEKSRRQACCRHILMEGSRPTFDGVHHRHRLVDGNDPSRCRSHWL